jgi:hypothetical protein
LYYSYITKCIRQESTVINLNNFLLLHKKLEVNRQSNQLESIDDLQSIFVVDDFKGGRRLGVHLQVVNHVSRKLIRPEALQVFVAGGSDDGRCGDALEGKHELDLIVVVGVQDVNGSDVSTVGKVGVSPRIQQDLKMIKINS